MGKLLGALRDAAAPVTAVEPLKAEKKTPLGGKDRRCYGTATPSWPVGPLIKASAEMEELTTKVAAAEERENAKEDPYANAVAWVEERMAELAAQGLTSEKLCEEQKRVIALLDAFINGNRRALKKKAGVRFSINGEVSKPEKTPPARKWALWGLTF